MHSPGSSCSAFIKPWLQALACEHKLRHRILITTQLRVRLCGRPLQCSPRAWQRGSLSDWSLDMSHDSGIEECLVVPELGWDGMVEPQG